MSFRSRSREPERPVPALLRRWRGRSGRESPRPRRPPSRARPARRGRRAPRAVPRGRSGTDRSRACAWSDLLPRDDASAIRARREGASARPCRGRSLLRILAGCTPGPSSRSPSSLAGSALAAEPPPPGGIPDLVGPRTLGLSAAIGTAAGNDGLYLNPGAIAARRRYSVETGLLLDRRGADTVDRFLGGSIVDSQTSPVTAGVSFLRAQEGDFTGNIVHLALAGPVAERFYLGRRRQVPLACAARRTRRRPPWTRACCGRSRTSSRSASPGTTSCRSANDAVAPMGAGAGVALGNDRSCPGHRRLAHRLRPARQDHEPLRRRAPRCCSARARPAPRRAG